MPIALEEQKTGFGPSFFSLCTLHISLNNNHVSPRVLCIIALLVLPATARAERATTWSFLANQVGPEWRINGQARTTAGIGGLHIATQSEVSIFRELNAEHPIHGVEITYLAPEGTEALLLWKEPGTPQNEVIQMPLPLYQALVPTQQRISIERYPDLSSRPEILGLRLPAGADVQILQIRLVGWGIVDRLKTAVQSFWKFDRMSPYSVNFLWGPVFAANPYALLRLFEDLPPQGTYANALWYKLLLVLVVLAWASSKWRRSWKIPAYAIACTVAVLWILSDVRMGAEIFSYAISDSAGLQAEDPQDTQFRERGNFPAFIADAAPLVADRGRYVFLTQYPYPFLGLMRYHTYPALPVAPEAAAEGIDTWVVFARGDLGIDPEGRLTSEGAPITAPGKILLDFGPDSFVFRTGA